MRRVVVEAPAKLNLALAVEGRDERGYHLLDMVMQAVDVFERVEIEKAKAFTLKMPGSRIPKNENNTAFKAAREFFWHTGLLAGAVVTVFKKLPTRAGLAGGSADAAAVLLGLNRLYNAKMNMEELCELGARVGSDVPFSLMGGTARVQGTGDKIAPLKPLAAGWFTIAMPKGRGNSTPEVYRIYDEMYFSGGEKRPLQPNIEVVVKAVESGDLPLLAGAMGNALEAAAADRQTYTLKEALMRNGALAAMMTGSGAAVFGLFENEAAAQGAARAVKERCQQVFVARAFSGGAALVDEN